MLRRSGLSTPRRSSAALLLSALVAGSLLAGVATAGAAPTTPRPPAPAPAAPGADYQPPPVAFGQCASQRLIAARALCGFVVVPLDYAQPGGPTIRIAISRVLHKTPVSQGLMLANPGGPGGSGLTQSTLQSRVPNGAGNGYDWIGFDPRGVGASEPRLSCQPGYQGDNRPYYNPIGSPLDETRWLTRSVGYAASCGVKGAGLLPHLHTTDTVADMESIRKALAQPQINYYGFSYGTYLGSVYATQHPDRVRRMVFDGVVDPGRVWEEANYDQDVAFERSIGVFFGWVARHDDVYHLGNTAAAVRQKYDAQYQALRRAPAGGRIGSSEWNDIFLQAGYYVFGWEGIASAFSRWVNQRDASGLVALYPPSTDDNGYAVYLGVQCIDAPWSRYPQFRARNAAVFPRAPFETWANSWFNAPCTFWPAPAARPVGVNGAAVPPILLVSETLDAATPYSGALAVRRLFPQSRLVEGFGGTTHAGTLFNSRCENRAVADYLTDGTLPDRAAGNGSDRQCDPNPQPEPRAVETFPPLPAGAPAAAAAAPLAGVVPPGTLPPGALPSGPLPSGAPARAAGPAAATDPAAMARAIIGRLPMRWPDD